jgi:hypothetical protein
MKQLPLINDKKPPLIHKRCPPPTWEGLSSPLDVDKIEAKANEFYVSPVRILVKALCDEIRNLRIDIEIEIGE